MNLDKKDRLILYELDRNSRQSDNEIAKKIRLNKNTVKFRIHRLKKLGIIKNFTTIINPSKINCSVFKIYLRLKNLRPKTKSSIINYLVPKRNVFWISQYEGGWDLIIATLAKTPYEFYEFYNEITSRFGKHISKKETTSQIEVPFFDRGYLLGEESKLKWVWGGNICKKKCGVADMKILKILAKDSKTPSTKIAEEIKSTPRKVIYRIKKMIRSGIILGFSINLNQELIGREYYKVMLYLMNYDPKEEEKLISFCKKTGKVIHFIKTLGPWDIELEIETKNHRELTRVLLDLKRDFSHYIKRYDSHLIIDEEKGEYNIVQ